MGELRRQDGEHRHAAYFLDQDYTRATIRRPEKGWVSKDPYGLSEYLETWDEPGRGQVPPFVQKTFDVLSIELGMSLKSAIEGQEGWGATLMEYQGLRCHTNGGGTEGLGCHTDVGVPGESGCVTLKEA